MKALIVESRTFFRKQMTTYLENHEMGWELNANLKKACESLESYRYSHIFVSGDLFQEADAAVKTEFFRNLGDSKLIMVGERAPFGTLGSPKAFAQLQTPFSKNDLQIAMSDTAKVAPASEEKTKPVVNIADRDLHSLSIELDEFMKAIEKTIPQLQNFYLSRKFSEMRQHTKRLKTYSLSLGFNTFGKSLEELQRAIDNQELENIAVHIMDVEDGKDEILAATEMAQISVTDEILNSCFV